MATYERPARATSAITRRSRDSARPSRPTTTCARCWCRSTRPPRQQGRLPHDQPRRRRRARGRRRRHRRRGGASTPPPPGALDRRHRRLLDDAVLLQVQGQLLQPRLVLQPPRQFVTVKNQDLDVTGRLLLLNSISLAPDSKKGFPLITAEVERELLPAAADPGHDRRQRPLRARRPPRPRRPAPTRHRTRDHHDRNHLWSHPMSVITDTWRFLVQRRLWPVAILLIVAAVAVPKLLASEPTAAPRAARRRGQERQRVRAGDRADRGSRGGRRPQRPPPGARHAQGPLQAAGHADADAASRRRPGPAPTAPDRPATTDDGARLAGGTDVGGRRRPPPRPRRPRRSTSSTS